ncbi:AAA family ATPase, partial [Mycobacterium tuberculosis]|nr:AAA family ATPase [Mycobacterium tuberculosis]
MNRYVVVTGTDTGVGKTVATAALAVRLRRAGHRVHIRKPAQTGLVADTDPRRSA